MLYVQFMIEHRSSSAYGSESQSAYIIFPARIAIRVIQIRQWDIGILVVYMSFEDMSLVDIDSLRS